MNITSPAVKNKSHRSGGFPRPVVHIHVKCIRAWWTAVTEPVRVVQYISQEADHKWCSLRRECSVCHVSWRVEGRGRHGWLHQIQSLTRAESEQSTPDTSQILRHKHNNNKHLLNICSTRKNFTWVKVI